MSDNWEDVNVPQGQFIGWGQKGQTVTGWVLAYGDTDGSDYNDQPCPLVVIELTEDAVNYRDKGTTKETIAKGEIVSVTCGQANLKRSVRAAVLDAGVMVRIAYEDDYKTAKGEGKAFKVSVNRARRSPVSSSDLV